MAVVDLQGIGQVEFAGDVPTADELKAVKIYVDSQRGAVAKSKAESTKEDIDPNTGYYKLPEVDSKVRFAVAQADTLEDKVKTLRKFYKEVKQDDYDATNFIVKDSIGKKYILNDKSKTNFGDVIDYSKGIGQAVAGTAGAIVGTGLGPAGTIGGAGAGTALGSEIMEGLGRLAGTEIDRTPAEWAKARAGDLVLGSVSQAAPAAVLKSFKYLIRGGAEETAQMLKDVNAFRSAGIQPTLGQVTENQLIDTVDVVLANAPFSAALMKKTAQETQNKLGQNSIKLSADLISRLEPASMEEAGLAVKQGLTGKSPLKDISGKGSFIDAKNGVNSSEGFLGRFKSESNLLYNRLNELVPNSTSVEVSNTTKYLQKLMGEREGISNLSGLFDNNIISKAFSSLEEDLAASQTGKLTYKQLQTVRSLVGEELASFTNIQGTQREFYKGLYRSLSQDMRSTIEKIGPEAMKRFESANGHFAKGAQSIDNFLENIIKNVDLDTLVNQLYTKSTRGSTTINEIKNALSIKGKPTDEYKVFLSAFIDKIGKAKPFGELAEDVAKGRTNNFSTKTFLQNWGAIDNKAKDMLFSGSGKEFQSLRSNLDNLAKVSTKIEESNPFKSGTGPARFAGQGIIIGASAAVLSGASPLFLFSIPVLGYGGAYASKLMSNPHFIDWLAKGTKIAGNKGFDGAMEHFGRLATVMAPADAGNRELTNQMLSILSHSSDKQEEVNKQKESIAPAKPIIKPKAGTVPMAQSPTQPQVNMFAANPQAQTPFAQVQAPQGQTSGFTNIPQDQLNKYSTLFGKVV
jgi:hypothetical protein